MRRNTIITWMLLLVGLLWGAGRQAWAADVKDAEATVATFKRTDPSIERFFSSSAGYAVFPTVGKGGLGVGGAHGSGMLFDRSGKALGKTSLTQLTVGLQAGGQTYSEIIFFETPRALADFEGGHFALSAQVSAVALSAGKAKTAKYEHGVAVFTATKTGLMYEASVGGQKFSYEPLKR
jgi:lipid-binding SYLF domain-containing protein